MKKIIPVLTAALMLSACGSIDSDQTEKATTAATTAKETTTTTAETTTTTTETTTTEPETEPEPEIPENAMIVRRSEDSENTVYSENSILQHFEYSVGDNGDITVVVTIIGSSDPDAKDFIYWCPYIKVTDDISGDTPVYDQVDKFSVSTLIPGAIEMHATTITPSEGWSTAELYVTLQYDTMGYGEYTYVPEDEDTCNFHITVTR